MAAAGAADSRLTVECCERDTDAATKSMDHDRYPLETHDGL